jgi:hypothetical protein
LVTGRLCLLRVAQFPLDSLTGKPDLVIGDLDSTGPVAILLGSGTGNFAAAPGPAPYIGDSAQVLTVADFNMDGNLDVAITSAETNQVVMLLGDGTGRFSLDPKGPFNALATF